MKKIVPIVVAVILLVAAAWFYVNRARFGLDAKIVEFNKDADNLIRGLQRYREFVGSFPKGSLVDIAKAVSGETDEAQKRVLIVASGVNKRNDKGELIDPWGTPIQFYFTPNSILIRSAGPNMIFEDSAIPGCDDLFRTEVKEEK